MVGDYSTDGMDQFHVTLGAAGKIYGMGLPGNVAVYNSGNFGYTANQSIGGNDTAIVSLAFANGKAYYTSSGGGAGAGSFGTIDLATMTTTQLLFGDGFHGLSYDPFTGDLIGFAGQTIVPVDPNTNTVVSRLVAPSQF